MTPCQCDEPGYCEVHQREMPSGRFRQCKNEPGQFELFQVTLKKLGPRSKRLTGLGDIVERVIEKSGVGKLAKGCKGCQKRKHRLNELVPFKE
ncbi:hypothetical protein Pla110_44490 [Polystyrenella longa]|uniref:Uncharacterized protein n=1 Tax=Polystyrenella longa TaxID=2528007 RepID=A0A518CU08_9PLAN|nr:hypothetical protein Pla110_44490 [Polystyrenella longa]